MKYYKEDNFIFFRNDKNNKLFINVKGVITFDDNNIKIESDELEKNVKEIIDSIRYKLGIKDYEISYSVFTKGDIYIGLLNNESKSIGIDKYVLEYILKNCDHTLLVCCDKFDLVNNKLYLRLSRVIGKFDEKIDDQYVNMFLNKFNIKEKIQFGNKFMNKKELFQQIDKIF